MTNRKRIMTQLFLTSWWCTNNNKLTLSTTCTSHCLCGVPAANKQSKSSQRERMWGNFHHLLIHSVLCFVSRDWYFSTWNWLDRSVQNSWTTGAEGGLRKAIVQALLKVMILTNSISIYVDKLRCR